MAQPTLRINVDADTDTFKAGVREFVRLWPRFGLQLDDAALRQYGVELAEGRLDLGKAIACDFDWPTGRAGNALVTAEPTELFFQLLVALRARERQFERVGASRHEGLPAGEGNGSDSTCGGNP